MHLVGQHDGKRVGTPALPFFSKIEALESFFSATHSLKAGASAALDHAV